MESLKSKLDFAEHFSRLDKATRKLTLCFVSLFEECNEKSINSHTISQVNLRLLSEKGHLLTFKRPDMFEAIKSDLSLKYSLEFEKVGLKAISSFPGFCSAHDTNLFKLIDSANLEFSLDAVELLVFRTFVHEAYKKLCSQYKTDSFSVVDTDAENDRLMVTEGFQLGYIDLVVQAQKIYQNLKSKKHDYKFLEIRFCSLLPFCFISPSNFEIKPSFGGKDPTAYTTYDSCLIGLIPTSSGSKFILAFPKSQQRNIKLFLKRLEPNKAQLPTQVLQLALESSENLYFQPSWVESISKEHRDILGKLFHRDLSVMDVLGEKFLPDGLLHYAGNIYASSNMLITRKWRESLS